MMYQQAIARRYAKGLMLTVDEGDLDQVEGDLSMLVEALSAESSDLFHLFDDPSFSSIERKAVINRIADASHMNVELRHFLLLLVNKARLKLLPFIQAAFVLLIDQERGRLRADIKSATLLSADAIDEIRNALANFSKKEVLLEATVVPELLGGVRIEMGGIVFDGTVRAKLDAIKNKLLYEVGTI